MSARAWLASAVVATLWATVMPAVGQGAPADPHGYHVAYEYALRCFAANAAAAKHPELNPAGQNQARYDADAKLAFDAAVKLGQLQGFSNRQLNHDLDVNDTVEIGHMARDETYFRQALSDCVRLGFARP